MEKEIIVGVHSVVLAIENRKRTGKVLYGTSDSIESLRKVLKSDLNGVEVIELKSVHELQQKAEKLFKVNGYKFSRVPNSLFLSSDPLEVESPNYIFNQLRSGKRIKLICLDQVSDPQNAAAISRTASFYGVDCIVVSGRGSFGRSPSFYRISSGAAEFVKIITVSNMSRFLNRLQEEDCLCIGLSEHSTLDSSTVNYDLEKSVALVLGNEEKGLSNAVSRVLKQTYSLNSKGAIKSLNVSVASAISMEKFFG